MDKQKKESEEQLKAKKRRYQINDEVIFDLDYTLEEEEKPKEEKELGGYHENGY